MLVLRAATPLFNIADFIVMIVCLFSKFNSVSIFFIKYRMIVTDLSALEFLKFWKVWINVPQARASTNLDVVQISKSGQTLTDLDTSSLILTIYQ